MRARLIGRGAGLVLVLAGSATLAAWAQDDAGRAAPSDGGAESLGGLGPIGGGGATGNADLGTITVFGKEYKSVGPLPGLDVTKEQIPSNIQSATGQELQESSAESLPGYMNEHMQGVNINDYASNPFQYNLQYRGFNAGPEIGTPQGLSVFFDGVRVNEPFGDTVNWDLIPFAAIESFDVFPGSNPLYGLNTLGGALSLQTKSGFTAPGVDIRGSAGSWGRHQIDGSAGWNNGEFAGFAAGSYFKEDGWRVNSPSLVRQGFVRGDWAPSFGQFTVEGLFADNELIGNGTIPVELFEEAPESVYTSPDYTKNRLNQISLKGLFDLTDDINITTNAYRRKSTRYSYNGDVYTEFEDFSALNGDIARINPPDYGGRPLCRYLDANGDGQRDNITVGGQTVMRPPLNAAENCIESSNQGTGPSRNGAKPGNGVPGTPGYGEEPGVIDGTPIGIISQSGLDQTSYGGSLQVNFNFEKHKFMLGISRDTSDTSYYTEQQLGLIDEQHNVYRAPDQIDPVYRAAQIGVPISNFSGDSRTDSLYFSETYSPVDNLHLTFAGRYNYSVVNSDLDSRLGRDLQNIRNLRRSYLLCSTPDPSSCQQVPSRDYDDLSSDSNYPTSDRFHYNSFNPSFGINWLPVDNVNLFANYSRGARVPSVVELGCAFDDTPVDLDGDPSTPGTTPRSLTGPTCSLPTALSGDPYLPQIRSNSYEVGARGSFASLWDVRNIQWNVSLYRTDLEDDIYLVSFGGSSNYFDSIGDTRRQGIELGFSGEIDKFDFSLNYAYTEATFESRFFTYQPYNSSADFNPEAPPQDPEPYPNPRGPTYLTQRIDPGALMPGVPLHNLNFHLNYHVTEDWRLGLGVVAHSKSFVRGNENNAHSAGGTDQQPPPTGNPDQPVPPGRPFLEDGQVPAYTVVNLDTSYNVTPELTVFARIDNVFDKTYYTAGRLGVNPFSPGVNGAIGPSGFNYNSSEWRNTKFVSPAAPRGYFVGLEYRFGG